MKNTIHNKKSELDQFYTKDSIAEYCYSLVLAQFKVESFDFLLEPSAGNGSFFKLLPTDKRIGLDLEPRSEGILRQDFFFYKPPPGSILTIGNPPFGRICSTAIKFFNRAADFSLVIAFIVPKTFKKQSIQNKLNQFFHLRSEEDLPKHSFVFQSQPYEVPSCFQIWERSSHKRVCKKIDIENDFFDFVTPNLADLAIRRVGGTAGRAHLITNGLCKTSHYFLRYKYKKMTKEVFVDKVNKIDFTKKSKATAGVRSLSKPELVDLIRKNV